MKVRIFSDLDRSRIHSGERAARREVAAAVSRPMKKATWISFTRNSTDILLERAVMAPACLRGAHLITLMPPRLESVPALLGLFHPVFGVVEGFQWLAKEELIGAITRDDASERLIGGSVDLKAKTMTLLRGDITSLIVPLSLFSKAGDGTAPDFTKFKLTDFGRTVALGMYESASDAIVYEVDLEYRRKLKKLRRQSEQTFGAALLRLREQRRLKRTDFNPISAKEIARLERNEVDNPHAKTLQVLAAKLGVGPEEIASY